MRHQSDLYCEFCKSQLIDCPYLEPSMSNALLVHLARSCSGVKSWAGLVSFWKSECKTNKQKSHELSYLSKSFKSPMKYTVCSFVYIALNNYYAQHSLRNTGLEYRTKRVLSGHSAYSFFMVTPLSMEKWRILKSACMPAGFTPLSFKTNPWSHSDK